MLLRIAAVVLVIWLVGVLGVFSVGDAIHVLLLGGLALGLLGVMRARDAALRSDRAKHGPASRS
jgi:hypothetical protein